MLHPLQVSATAVQACADKSQQSVLELPSGSVVYARLRPNGLYERAELLSVQPGHSAALIALHSTGAQHRLASEQLVQSVTIQQHTALSDSGGSDAHSQSEASSDFNSQDEEDAVAQSRVRGHVASAVWDADEAAMQV